MATSGTDDLLNSVAISLSDSGKFWPVTREQKKLGSAKVLKKANKMNVVAIAKTQRSWRLEVIGCKRCRLDLSFRPFWKELKYQVCILWIE